MTSDIPLIQRVNIDHTVEHSLRDYHVKGFDYICLKRTPTETVKLYFFDGDITRLPEVVNPHDHRYPFQTLVMTGCSENLWFVPSKDDGGKVYNRFEYRTPLNGGDGFTFAGEERLKALSRVRFRSGQFYSMEADQLHTIRIVENETVLMLIQREDVVPLDQPTLTFTQGDAPSLEGLYKKFTADEIIARLTRFEERYGVILKGGPA